MRAVFSEIRFVLRVQGMGSNPPMTAFTDPVGLRDSASVLYSLGP